MRINWVNRTTVTGGFHANSPLMTQSKQKRQALNRTTAQVAGFTLIESLVISQSPIEVLKALSSQWCDLLA